jgi:hypothetical protein
MKAVAAKFEASHYFLDYFKNFPGAAQQAALAGGESLSGKQPVWLKHPECLRGGRRDSGGAYRDAPMSLAWVHESPVSRVWHCQNP